MKPSLIYLNGTSSCGKSTIAKALYELLPNSTVISADEFGKAFETHIDKSDPVYVTINKLYDNCIAAIQQAKTDAERQQGFNKLYQALDKNPLPERFNSDLAMYNHIKELLQTEQMVIVDDLISTEHLYDAFLNTFKHVLVDITMVKIDCDLDILAKRERQRGDRLIGMAAFWHQVAHQGKKYDVIVDSGKDTPQICAKQIYRAICIDD